jgi:hypothetical protein
MKQKNYEGYTFKPVKTKVIKNHYDWTFTTMFQQFGSKNVNDKPKYQRPDVDGSLLLFGEGNDWQKQLMKDIIKGNPFQPIHLRYNSEIWEIVDGGHRTRTVYKFLNGFIRLPEDTILKDVDGNEFDISNMTIMDIIKEYPFLQSYIWNLTFEVYEYRDISNKEAEDLFLKLNDLHDMSHADKRNAIDNIVADVCRERGAVDSIKAINIFKEILHKGKDKTLAHVSIPLTKRATDEMISFALYYLYKGGVFGNDFGGLESQPELNDMYRDEELIKRLSNPKDNIISELDSLLKIVNGVVMEGRLSNSRSGNWGKGSLKKLIMLVTESARNAGGFGKYKPDTKKLYKELNEAYTQLTKSKVAHHPFQLYEVIGGKVVPLSEDKQPKNVKKHETYQFPSVFTGGARVDDLLYIYHHFITKDVFKFGLKTTSKDDSRTFNKKQNEEMWAEQNGECKKCGCDLNTNDYAADHILGHTYGGPTELKNGQLLCVSCNSMKSSGMDINDVEYLCKKYEYDDFAGLSKYVLKGAVTLTEFQIKELKQIVIG